MIIMTSAADRDHMRHLGSEKLIHEYSGCRRSAALLALLIDIINIVNRHTLFTDSVIEKAVKPLYLCEGSQVLLTDRAWYAVVNH